MKTINTPLTDEVTASLNSGDKVLITGTIYTARDSAHKLLIQMIEKKEPLPFDINGAIIYYVGPTPNKPSEVIGSAGPTTSSRMDSFTPTLLQAGLKGMIGKGNRSENTINSIKNNNAIYFAATGGAGALLSKHIIKSEVIAFEHLGTEAVRKLQVENFPVTVINDTEGHDLYSFGKERYKT